VKSHSEKRLGERKAKSLNIINAICFWKGVQKHVSETVRLDLYDSRAFLIGSEFDLCYCMNHMKTSRFL